MYLARHGQTMFNVVFGETKQDPGIEDPPLTETGHAQARELARVASAGVTGTGAGVGSKCWRHWRVQGASGESRQHGRRREYE